MASRSSRWQRRIEAATSASRLLDELNVDASQQIDVFGICEDLGLWLAFAPLDKLLGVFLAEGAGGILITTQRPIPVQRYTAAHEIGHWRLDHRHDISVDNERNVLGATTDEREQLAQVFAASLLMPPPLVFGVLARLNIVDDLQPEHAYAVAREAGVSFEAAVRQLTHLEVISGGDGARLLQRRPMEVKASLALGRRPLNGYADVWPVDEQWHGQTLLVHVEDELVVSLPENRTTGFRWMLAGHEPRPPSPEPPAFQAPVPTSFQVAVLDELRGDLASQRASGRAPRGALDRVRHVPETSSASELAGTEVEIVGDEYVPARAPWLPKRRSRQLRLTQHSAPAVAEGDRLEPTSEPLVGAAGRRVLGIRLSRPGPTTIHLQYRSAYGSADPLSEYSLSVVAEARRTGFSVDQLAGEDDPAWARAVRERQLKQVPAPIQDPDASDAAGPTEPSSGWL